MQDDVAGAGTCSRPIVNRLRLRDNIYGVKGAIRLQRFELRILS